MTTIAFDGKTLASDSLVTCDGMICGDVTKIHRIDGGYIGCAGDLSDIASVVYWLQGTSDKPKDVSVFSAIIVLDDGRAFEMDERMVRFQCAIPNAVGSGAKYALTAMKLGKSASEAVEVAISMDIYSGGEVVSYELPAGR